MSLPSITINNRKIGPGEKPYIIAEMSGNHGHDFDTAVKIIEAAKNSGADAIKLQTYTPDTITIDARNEYFMVGEGTIWEGRSLYDLYGDAYTPWEWQPKLKAIAEQMGLDFFSTPFDNTAVDFLEEMEVPVYKVASFEVVDIPLLKKIAETGKPVIMSNGMATLAELEEAILTLRKHGTQQLALLKCTSGYPAALSEMNLKTIPNLQQTFNLPVGLSDHTLDIAVPITAVALGACIIEKHFTLDRNVPGPDNAFSLEPREFKAMVKAVHASVESLGSVKYGSQEQESSSSVFRKSLFIVEDMKAGEQFTASNVRSIRPGYGLHPRHLEEVIGRKAQKNIKRGTPLHWELVS